MITWRDYQTEAIDKVFRGWEKYQRMLGVAPTGAGKTALFWGVVDRFLELSPNARSLILAHREELIAQPFERANKFFPHLKSKIGIVMGQQDAPHKQILIGTIQTVGGRSKKRLDLIHRYGKIDLLIVDEAHHAEAPQYYNLYRNLLEVNPDLRVLGVTATPERGDKKLLTKIFEHEVFNIPIRRLIDEGHLVEPIIHGIKTKVDLRKTKVNGKGGKRDYKTDDLVAAFETSDVFDLVVKTHLEHCGERPTIAFTVSVNGAIRLTQMLRDKGVKAVALYSTRKGESPAVAKERRKDALDGIKSGRYTCLINVMVATEGYDFPPLEYLHIVRPTKSDGLWLQIVGRVLRPSPETGKIVATIFDYLPVADRNFEQRMQIYKKPKQHRASPEEPIVRGTSKDDRPDSTGEVEMVILDYFNRREEAWLQTTEGWRCIQLGKGVDPKSRRQVERGLALSPDGMQLWAIWRFVGDKQFGIRGDRWAKAKVIGDGDAHQNLQMIDTFTQEYGNRIIMSRSAEWRNREPSPGFMQWGRSLQVYKEGMRQGELSDAINEKLILDAVRRGMKEASKLEREKALEF